MIGLASMAKLRVDVSSEAGAPLIPADKEETDDEKKSYTRVCVCGWEEVIIFGYTLSNEKLLLRVNV